MKIGAQFISAAIYSVIQKNLIKKEKASLRDYKRAIDGILDIMKELAHEGLTMAVVTHEMSFAKHVSDRVVYMENGVIVEDGKPMDVLENPHSESLAKFLGKHNH